jgi:hypothetical protein
VRVIPSFAALARDFAAELNFAGAARAKKSLALLYLSSWEFDEDWYLTNNPDLAEAIPSSTFRSGWHHFVNVGYFEGRSPAEPLVDNEWYMSRYEDVASAILDGIFADARDHYVKLGRSEGRVPCDPGIDVDWYAKRYLEQDEAEGADAKTCTEHFIRFGYLSGALPAPPC